MFGTNRAKVIGQKEENYYKKQTRRRERSETERNRLPLHGWQTLGGSAAENVGNGSEQEENEVLGMAEEIPVPTRRRSCRARATRARGARVGAHTTVAAVVAVVALVVVTTLVVVVVVVAVAAVATTTPSLLAAATGPGGVVVGALVDAVAEASTAICLSHELHQEGTVKRNLGVVLIASQHTSEGIVVVLVGKLDTHHAATGMSENSVSRDIGPEEQIDEAGPASHFVFVAGVEVRTTPSPVDSVAAAVAGDLVDGAQNVLVIHDVNVIASRALNRSRRLVYVVISRGVEVILVIKNSSDGVLVLGISGLTLDKAVEHSR